MLSVAATKHTFSQASQKSNIFHINAKMNDYLTSEFGEHTFFRHLFKNSSDDKIRLKIYEDNENFRLSSLRIAKYFCVFHKSKLSKFRRHLGLLSESYIMVEIL